MNKTIFVTGSAGFIGSNLVLKLLKENEKIHIIGIDNMNDYYDVSIKEYRLNKIKEEVKKTTNKWSFYYGNISDKNLIDKIFEEHRPDIVVNLAAQAGVRYSISNPDAYIESNLIGFYNILEACRHSYDDGNKAFANGDAVMIINGNWAINQYKNANADINVDMFALPASNEKSQNYVTSGVDVLLGVCKDSANEEVAKEFVSFMLEPENAKMYIDDQFAFSAVKGVEQENETVAGVKEDIAAGKVANFPDHYYPSGFDMSALLTEMCLNYTNGMDNEENINQFLAQCDEKYDIANVD